MTAESPWSALRRYTEARIGLGRAGAALPIKEVLQFAMAHARARDAVTTPIDWRPIEERLHELGQKFLRVESAAADRDIYLRRPDLGRRLNPRSRERLVAAARPTPDLLIVIADGLSSTGVAANAPDVVAALLPMAKKAEWSIAPIALASEARVALGDDIGEILGARAVLVLIGERPGLSSPDSLGAYLTYAPRVGCTDAERNCVSNIRTGGLTATEAAHKIHWLLREAFRRRLTGVALKDESTAALDASQATTPLPAK
jgi:ethanolamine ammonia-lyase small subunit